MHDQAAGYALDALDAEEAREFERHLQLCPACEEELGPLRIAAVALAFAGELPPPRSALRRRVVVPRLRRRWHAPLASAAALAACAAIAVGLAANPPRRHVSFELPPVPAGKVYEIWFVRHGQAVPAGFARAGRTELAHVPPGAAVAVTLEPRGGSRRPTGPLLVRAETA
jgi:anti-sigma-K factor RskA